MRAFSVAALFVSLFVVVACDEEYIEDPRILVSPSSGDASQLHSRLCAAHQRVFFLAEGSVIHWQAMKNGDIPVNGTQKVSGYVASGSATQLASLEVRLDFDVSSVDSADSLRDTRVMNYILGLSEGLPMHFDSESTTVEGVAFPVDGEEIAGSFAGTLTMTNKRSPVTVEAILKRSPIGLTLSSGPSPWMVNLVSQLQLGPEVGRLMALVDDVTMDEEVAITFDLALEEDCP